MKKKQIMYGYEVYSEDNTVTEIYRVGEYKRLIPYRPHWNRFEGRYEGYNNCSGCTPCTLKHLIEEDKIIFQEC